MNPRSTENQIAYDNFKKNYTGTCFFCDFNERAPGSIIEVTSTMMVTKNEYPYSLWDEHPIADHLMFFPVRHIFAFADFTRHEEHDYFDLMKKYEADGYSIYSRAPTNYMRTASHLHTHLIKLSKQV